MAMLYVHWRHEQFSHDAGVRSNADAARSEEDAARTGVLTDEHQDVVDYRPVLQEDYTGRIYRAADLPPETIIFVPNLQGPLPPIIEHAKQAGFNIRPA